VSVEGRELIWCCDLADAAGWPHAVAEAAYEAFGGSLFNQQSRTFKSLNRRISHAIAVWEEKYGPFNEQQEVYATRILMRCIQKGHALAGTDRTKRFPFVLAFLAQAVNHEKVDRGFKKRESEFTSELAELLSSQLSKAVPA
jgi:hypothetical protein